MGVVANLYNDLVGINIHKYIRELPRVNMRVYSHALFVAEMMDMTTEELLTQMGFDYKFYTAPDVDVALLSSQLLAEFPDFNANYFKKDLSRKAYKTGLSLIERRYGIGAGVVVRELGFKLDKYAYKIRDLERFLDVLYPDNLIYGLNNEPRIQSLIKTQIDVEEETIYDYLIDHGFAKQEGQGFSVRERVQTEFERFRYAVVPQQITDEMRNFASEMELSRRELVLALLNTYSDRKVDARALPEYLKTHLKEVSDYLGLHPQKALNSWGFTHNPSSIWNSTTTAIAPTVAQAVEPTAHFPRLEPTKQEPVNLTDIFGAVAPATIHD